MSNLLDKGRQRGVGDGKKSRPLFADRPCTKIYLKKEFSLVKRLNKNWLTDFETTSTKLGLYY